MAELNGAFSVAPVAGDVPTLALRGELDSANVELLREQVDALLARGPSRIVFDVTELRFMDSAGIAVLVTTAAAVGEVAVRNPSPILRRVLAATGLTDLLRLEP
jgi:anti-sigma B factor antagonist